MSERRKKCCHYDKLYLRSLLAKLKIAQIVVLFFAWVLVVAFVDRVTFPNTKFSKLQFFVLVTMVAWLTCIVVFVINVTKASRRLPVPWYWVYLVQGVLFALFLFIALVFLGNAVETMKETRRIFTPATGHGQQTVVECHFIELTDSGTRCDYLTAGTVFGVFSLALFIAEIVVASHKLRHGDVSLYITATSQMPDDDVTISSDLGDGRMSRVSSQRGAHKDMYSASEATQPYSSQVMF